MLTPPQATIKQATAPIADWLCHQLQHQHAISAQTHDHIFHWFHLLQSTNNGSQPPDVVSYTTLLTNQLHFNHTIDTHTLKQLICWIQFQQNVNMSIGNGIWTFSLFRAQVDKDIFDAQRDI